MEGKRKSKENKCQQNYNKIHSLNFRYNICLGIADLSLGFSNEREGDMEKHFNNFLNNLFREIKAK